MEAKDNSAVESGRTGLNSFLGSISSRNETKDAILRSHTWKDENQHNWLSFFVIPLSCNQTTAKKEENVEYENHTHFKYDSQININHWPTDEKTIRYVQKSS